MHNISSRRVTQRLSTLGIARSSAGRIPSTTINAAAAPSRNISNGGRIGRIESVGGIGRAGNIGSARGIQTSRVASSTTPVQPTTDVGYLPNSSSLITTDLQFFDSVSEKAIPTYRVLDGNGNVLDGAQVPEVSRIFYSSLGPLVIDNILYIYRLTKSLQESCMTE